jgi:hypothetical protein
MPTDNEETIPNWTEIIHALRERLMPITQLPDGPETIWSMDMPPQTLGEGEMESAADEPPAPPEGEKALARLGVYFARNSFPEAGLYEGEALLTLRAVTTASSSALTVWAANRLAGWEYEGDNWRLRGFQLSAAEKTPNGGRALHFKFTAWTKPLTQVLFSYGDTEITLPAPILKKTAETEALNVSQRSAAGNIIVQDGGIIRKTITLHFTGLKEEEYANIENFFTLTKGNALPFLFTDADGNGKTVRWAEPKMSMEWTAHDGLHMAARLVEELETV